MQNPAPIALFVYNRPEHTRRTLAFLKQNLLAEDSRLFIFSDGPANASDEERVRDVRRLIADTEGFRSCEVVLRKENMGLAASIVDGVTTLVNEYGKVIVFEDDLITSPFTLTWFNEALKKYEQEDKVMHVGGYMFPIRTENLPESFFYRSTNSWGWATWKRAWMHFEPDADRLINQFSPEQIFSFEMDGTMNYWKHMLDFKKGRNNSWAIRWYASVFLRGGLSLYPAQSLVENFGTDGSGIHSGITSMYAVNIRKDQVTEWPHNVQENIRAVEAIKSFLKRRKGNLLKRGMRFVNQLVRSLRKRPSSGTPR